MLARFRTRATVAQTFLAVRLDSTNSPAEGSLIANRPSRSHDPLPPQSPHWHPEGKSIFLTWNSMAPCQPTSSEPPAQPGMAVPRKTPPAENSSYWTQLWTPPLPGLWLANPEIANCAEHPILCGVEDIQIVPG